MYAQNMSERGQPSEDGNVQTVLFTDALRGTYAQENPLDAGSFGLSPNGTIDNSVSPPPSRIGKGMVLIGFGVVVMIVTAVLHPITLWH